MRNQFSTKLLDIFGVAVGVGALAADFACSAVMCGAHKIGIQLVDRPLFITRLVGFDHE